VVNIKEISVSDLEKIKGGTSITVGVSLMIVAIITFVAGIIEGLSYPRRCSE